eukprot:Nitzschia sp. Nitz4//scaffold64_size103689//45105//46723//NITZ4_004433-RA/size103689-snap-gene-0.114-mRNA-1//1//CDS//3329556121//1869//frame0
MSNVQSYSHNTMRRKQGLFGSGDDADIAAGIVPRIPSPPPSKGSSSVITSASDIEFFEDMVSEPVLVLGMDISHLSRRNQFLLCAFGVFSFSLLYGYLQELLSVQLCSRQLGLFLAMVQFMGYTALAFVMRTYVYETQKRKKFREASASGVPTPILKENPVPFLLYLALSLLRAVDLGMTNIAMQYINYPAKTLMKSSRVVFTMIFGVIITKKVYKCMDYFVVLCMVAGLAIFMHADANSSAVFEPLGVIMLTVSLICDGAITNMSENIMNQYGVGQDEFIFRMYSIALIAITAAAIAKGDMRDGIVWILEPGTYAEQQSNVPLEERSWSSTGKIGTMIVFSSMGFFGSSCSAAITKNFGALTMSITSTARKATTLFLSFLLFDNTCTMEHIVGIVVFISALTAKSLRRKDKHRHSHLPRPMAMIKSQRSRSEDVEQGMRSNGSLNSFGSLSQESGDGTTPRRKPRGDGSRRRSNTSSPRARYHVV